MEMEFLKIVVTEDVIFFLYTKTDLSVKTLNPSIKVKMPYILEEQMNLVL